MHGAPLSRAGQDSPPVRCAALHPAQTCLLQHMHTHTRTHTQASKHVAYLAPVHALQPWLAPTLRPPSPEVLHRLRHSRAVQAHHNAASWLAVNLDIEEHLQWAGSRGGVSGTSACTHPAGQRVQQAASSCAGKSNRRPGISCLVCDRQLRPSARHNGTGPGQQRSGGVYTARYAEVQVDGRWHCRSTGLSQGRAPCS